MKIHLRGYVDEDANDPVIIVPPCVVDYRVFPNDLSKPHREDLQILQFALTVAQTSVYDDPIEILSGGDPPDRIIRVDSIDIALELTELTTEDAREEIAQVRKIGRLAESLVCDEIESFPHLNGKCIHISLIPGTDVPRNVRTIAEEIRTRLRKDIGHTGENIVDGRLPEHLAENPRGFYGAIGPVMMTATLGDSNDSIQIIATVACPDRVVRFQS
jgi:hypothetical protein